jgi:hypothetical protein
MNMSNKLKLAFLAAVLAVIGAISSPWRQSGPMGGMPTGWSRVTG